MSRSSLFVVRPTMGTGGADRVTVTLLRELGRQGFEPTLVLIRAQGRLLAEVPADVEVVSLDASGILAAAPALRRRLLTPPTCLPTL